MARSPWWYCFPPVVVVAASAAAAAAAAVAALAAETAADAVLCVPRPNREASRSLAVDLLGLLNLYKSHQLACLFTNSQSKSRVDRDSIYKV